MSIFCDHCEEYLNEKNFKSYNNNTYCENCYVKYAIIKDEEKYFDIIEDIEKFDKMGALFISSYKEKGFDIRAINRLTEILHNVEEIESIYYVWKLTWLFFTDKRIFYFAPNYSLKYTWEYDNIYDCPYISLIIDDLTYDKIKSIEIYDCSKEYSDRTIVREYSRKFYVQSYRHLEDLPAFGHPMTFKMYMLYILAANSEENIKFLTDPSWQTKELIGELIKKNNDIKINKRDYKKMFKNT